MKKDVKILLNHVEKKIIETLHERPSKDTLDRLAIFAGFQNWESFRKEINGDNIAEKKDEADKK